jgi:transcriptional regulator with XRE-family HTH domain
MPVDPTTGARLRRARLKRRLTQAQLADAAGIAQETLSNLELGLRRGADETWERIYAALDAVPERPFTRREL